MRRTLPRPRERLGSQTPARARAKSVTAPRYQRTRPRPRPAVNCSATFRSATTSSTGRRRSWAPRTAPTAPGVFPQHSQGGLPDDQAAESHAPDAHLPLQHQRESLKIFAGHPEGPVVAGAGDQEGGHAICSLLTARRTPTGRPAESALPQVRPRTAASTTRPGGAKEKLDGPGVKVPRPVNEISRGTPRRCCLPGGGVGSSAPSASKYARGRRRWRRPWATSKSSATRCFSIRTA